MVSTTDNYFSHFSSLSILCSDLLRFERNGEVAVVKPDRGGIDLAKPYLHFHREKLSNI